MTSIGGLVLAGGSGRRFGRPKASVTFGGQSLVARAVALLAPYCVETAVATRAEIPTPAVPARVVYDRYEPSALRGLASGLSSLATDSVLVLACDLLVQPSLLDKLVETARAGGASSVVAADENGRIQPLCALYLRAPALAACEALIDSEDLRVRRLPELLEAVVVTAPEGALVNVNTPDDLLRWESGGESMRVCE